MKKIVIISHLGFPVITQVKAKIISQNKKNPLKNMNKINKRQLSLTAPASPRPPDKSKMHIV